MNRHAIITGTGRAGTTMLVQILTAIGEDTGAEDLTYLEHCRAGLEFLDVEAPDAPYWVKAPAYCELLSGIVARGIVHIDCVYVCWRDVEAVSASRARVQGDSVKRVNGGFTGLFASVEAQTAGSFRQLHALFSALAPTSIPVVFIDFETAKSDPAYLFAKLIDRIGASWEDFLRAHNQIVSPCAQP